MTNTTCPAWESADDSVDAWADMIAVGTPVSTEPTDAQWAAAERAAERRADADEDAAGRNGW